MGSTSQALIAALDPEIESVEFKITVEASQEELVRNDLRQLGLEPQRRNVYLFETREKALRTAGVVLRARVTHGGADDSTVKLRPVVPRDIDSSLKAIEDFEIELDMVGDTAVCSAKLSVGQDRGEIERAAAGKRPLRTLFSEDQERLIADYGPIALSWNDLVAVGPVEIHKWETKPVGFPYEVTVEEWILDTDHDLIELSIKASPAEAVEAGTAFDAYLVDLGLDTSGDQQAKAGAVLDFYLP
jgi:hypothetical protein